MTVTDFEVGQAVILTRCVQPFARGQIGTIEKIVKTRKALRIRLDSGNWAGQTYDAQAENVDHFPEIS